MLRDQWHRAIIHTTNYKKVHREIAKQSTQATQFPGPSSMSQQRANAMTTTVGRTAMVQHTVGRTAMGQHTVGQHTVGRMDQG